MSSPYEDFALLLEAPDLVKAELARNLLDEAGIPYLVHGQDRDFAELGFAVHTVMSQPDLLVPKAALERARELLEDAWPPEARS